MKIFKKAVLIFAIAIIFGLGPAYAGIGQTNSAWVQERDSVQESVSDKAALSKIDALNSRFNDAFGLSREELYEVAAKLFAELTEISAANNGAKVTTPAWLGH